jgi:hypothetical protein
MRSNHNPSVSSNRSAGTKLHMPMPEMPANWLESGSWRLPSGKALAEFAFEAGFLAPLLFRVERLGRNGLGPVARAPQGRDKDFGTGGDQ